MTTEASKMTTKPPDYVNAIENRPNEIDDRAVRSKYLEIVQSLNLVELKRFNKCQYKKLVKADLEELVPEADIKVVDDTAHYISNTLNNEAICQRAIKLRTKGYSNARTTRRNSVPEISTVKRISNARATRRTSVPEICTTDDNLTGVDKRTTEMIL